MRNLLNKFSYATLYQTFGMIGSLLIFFVLVNDTDIGVVGEYTFLIGALALIFGITDFSSNNFCLRQLSRDDLQYLKIFFYLRIILLVILYTIVQSFLSVSPSLLSIVFVVFALNFEFLSFYLKNYRALCLTRFFLLLLILAYAQFSNISTLDTYIFCWAVVNFVPKTIACLYPPGREVLRNIIFTPITIEDFKNRMPLYIGAMANSFNSLVMNSGVWVLSGMILTNSQIGTLSIYMKLKIPFQLANIVLSAYSIPVLSNVRDDAESFLKKHRIIEKLVRNSYFLILLLISLGCIVGKNWVESVTGSFDLLLLCICVLVNIPVAVSLSSGLLYIFALGEDGVYAKYVFANAILVIVLIVLSSPAQSIYSIPIVLLLSEIVLAAQFIREKKKIELS